MQTKLVIEMIVDFRDKAKLEPFITAAKRAAARLNANAQLLADGQHPQVICYSDDFFTGRTELEYLNEQMLQEEVQDWQKSACEDEDAANYEPPVSDEFLDALKG